MVQLEPLSLGTIGAIDKAMSRIMALRLFGAKPLSVTGSGRSAASHYL
jgi:hypothetical protein